MCRTRDHTNFVDVFVPCSARMPCQPTPMAMDGESLHIIGKALDHSTPTATAIYTRLTDDPVRRAMATTGEKLAVFEGHSEVS